MQVLVDREAGGVTASTSAARVETAVVSLTDVVALGVVVAVAPLQWWQDAAIASAIVLLATLNGSYRRPRVDPRISSSLQAAARTVVAPLSAVAVLVALGVVGRDAAWSVAASAAGVAVSRCLSGIAIGRMRSVGRLTYRVLLVGGGEVADEVAAGCRRQARSGLTIVRRIDDPSAADLLAEVDAHQVDVVIVAYAPIRDHHLLDPLQRLRQRSTEVFVVPRLFEFGAASGDARTESCGGVPLVWLPQLSWRPEQLAVKRAFDIVVAGITLILATPLLVTIAAAVKFSSRGPVLIKQTRLGRELRPFEMYKFRTMRHGIDPTASQSGGDSPDRTGVGRVLRRLSLDELPQLVNVLRGDMSLVGPRPEQPHFVEQFMDVPGYAARHRVPVGITGWAQVNELRGSGSSLKDRAMYDNYYIEHWSPWFDLAILLRTVAASAKGS